MIFDRFFSNKVKEQLQTYFFFQELVHNLHSIEQFKTRLSNYPQQKVYKGDFNHFYLLKEEAQALSESFEELSFADVAASEVDPLLLLHACERITLYSKADLKHIPKKSELVWFYGIGGIKNHFVLYKSSFLYPQDYNNQNIFYHGYLRVYDKDKKIGLYDINQEKLVMEKKYTYLKNLSNLVEYSFDAKNYTIYDLRSQKELKTSTKPLLDNIDVTLKKYIDPSGLSVKEFVTLVGELRSKKDFVSCGLWDAYVGVIPLPEQYEGIIKESQGHIKWEYPVTLDIFDTSKELPVMFEKYDGSFVTVGIALEHIVLSKESAAKLSFVPASFTHTPSQHSSKKPLWLEIKNAEFHSSDADQNSLAFLTSLDLDEFDRFVKMLAQEKISMLFIYLATLDRIDQAFFLTYLDELGIPQEQASAFTSTIEEFDLSKVPEDIIARVSKELPMVIIAAKEYVKQEKKLYKRYKEQALFIEDETLHFIEKSLFFASYIYEMKYLPSYYEQVLEEFFKLYDVSKHSHKELALHLVHYYGVGIYAFYILQKAQEEPYEALERFVKEFSKEIEASDIADILLYDPTLFYMINSFSFIIQEDDANFINSFIMFVESLMEYLPFSFDAFVYALEELMKSFALKEVSVSQANSFLELFEKVVTYYEKLSYDQIISLKEMINQTISKEKPHENAVFEQEGVKNKVILLNFLLDMEDIKIADK